MTDVSEPKNLGEAMLLRLKRLGVDFFFANPGTEFVSVIRGFHDLPKNSVPEPILASHEFQAVSMAYGAYLASGRAQAVMTHANVGAANALIGLIGASRMNIPLIFIAGMTSFTEREKPGHRNKLIHWSQDAKDQGAIYREYVKWEIEVQDASTIYDVLDRAYAIATTAPCGPVAIHIARDLLVSEDVPTEPRTIQVKAAGAPAPAAQDLRTVLECLESARRPLFVTNRLGVDEDAVALLDKIAKIQGIGVVTLDDFYLSLPADHPNHLGFRHGPALQEADLVIVLDTDVPWYPLENGPNHEAKVLHVGPDPFFAGIPLRSHRGDLFIRSSPKEFLLAINETRPRESVMEERKSWIRSRRPNGITPATSSGDKLTAESVSSVLSEVLNERTVVINELGLVPESLICRHPGAYFRSGSASPLGWGVGCGLGIGLTKKEKTIIVCLGDGVFYFSPVLGAMTFAAQHGIAFVLLILNNGGMQSVANATHEYYPMKKSELPLTTFYSEGVHLDKCAAFVSGLGIQAKSRIELRQALHEGLDFARNERRPVVINAVAERM